MTGDDEARATLPFDEVQETLKRVRQIDATGEEAAVRDYVREIAEAEAMLDTIALGDAPLLVGFTASWPVRYER